jgi:hypothetical protein
MKDLAAGMVGKAIKNCFDVILDLCVDCGNSDVSPMAAENVLRGRHSWLTKE